MMTRKSLPVEEGEASGLTEGSVMEKDLQLRREDDLHCASALTKGSIYLDLDEE